MFQRLSVKKPKLDFHEAADTIFLKLFKEEVSRAAIRIKLRMADHRQMVRRDKLDLIIVSLFVFAVEHSASSVYGDSRTKNKLMTAFYKLIRMQFEEYYEFIIELSQKFGKSYRKNPKEPLLELGLCFSNYIKNDNKNDVLAAMAGTTESAQKIRLITNYYMELNKEHKI